MQPEIKINRLTKNHILTIEIKVTKAFKIRFIAAILLIKLAASILGCGIDIKNLNEE